MLQEEFEGLREADEFSAIHVERSNFGSAIVYEPASVVFWRAGGRWRRAVDGFLHSGQHAGSC